MVKTVPYQSQALQAQSAYTTSSKNSFEPYLSKYGSAVLMESVKALLALGFRRYVRAVK
jgi:hypothetical protein